MLTDLLVKVARPDERLEQDAVAPVFELKNDASCIVALRSSSYKLHTIQCDDRRIAQLIWCQLAIESFFYLSSIWHLTVFLERHLV